MPSVPYTGVPAVAPLNVPTPELRVNTPGEAFGTNVGQAMQGLGHQLEGSGSEIFHRAVAFQQLRNETDARDADANYMMQVNDLYTNMESLQGKAAVDALPKFRQDVENLRKQIREGLPNDEARRQYDAQSLSTMGRTIFSAARHAANEHKQWTIGSAVSQMKLDAKSIEDDPDDDVLFQDKIRRTRSNAATVADAKGMDDVQGRLLGLEATSKLWMQRVIGKARVEPTAAAAMLDEHRKEFTEEDFLRADSVVRAQSRSIGSAEIANQVWDKFKGSEDKPEGTYKEMEAEARRLAKKLNPDDPVLENHAIAALHSRVAQAKQADRDERTESQQIVNEAIRTGVTDERELRLNPKVAAAIDRLPAKDQLAIPGAINRYNAARMKVTNQDNYQRLMGLSNNDVEAFLNTDMTKENLNQADMRMFQKKQEELKRIPTSDPRVTRALGWMRGAVPSQLEALGIFRRTTNNTEDYDHYTGAMQSALDVWQETHGKPATYKDVIDTIGPQLIKQRTVPGFWNIGGYGTTNEKPFFTQEVPDKWAEDYSAAVTEREGKAPTPERIYRDYIRAQLIELYDKRAKPKPAAPAEPTTPPDIRDDF